MHTAQFLLVKLAEEASELAQIALKSAQFGMEEVYLGQQPLLSNAERTHAELNDLLGVVEELNARTAFGFDPDPTAMHKKRMKMAHYENYARSLGEVVDTGSPLPLQLNGIQSHIYETAKNALHSACQESGQDKDRGRRMSEQVIEALLRAADILRAQQTDP